MKWNLYKMKAEIGMHNSNMHTCVSHSNKLRLDATLVCVCVQCTVYISFQCSLFCGYHAIWILIEQKIANGLKTIPNRRVIWWESLQIKMKKIFDFFTIFKRRSNIRKLMRERERETVSVCAHLFAFLKYKYFSLRVNQLLMNSFGSF